MNYVRACKCGKLLSYKTISSYEKALNKNTMCPSCRTQHNNNSPNRNTKKENNPAWCGYGDIPGKVHSKLKRDAIKRSIYFEITIEEISDQYEAQDKLCAFTGIPLTFGIDASVDRIDSNMGYNPNNIQIVHKALNMMKKDMTNESFIAWCKLVANHGKGQPMGLSSAKSVELEPSMEMVKSPCNGICTLDITDTCRGCQRTRSQISKWYAMSNEEKLSVLKSLPIGNIC